MSQWYAFKTVCGEKDNDLDSPGIVKKLLPS